jgi:ketosteroid isomerase-like protein
MKIHHFAAMLVAVAACAFCLTETSAASGGSTPGAVLNRAIAAFNAGDMKAWAANCAPATAIVDEIPPHAWQGPSACTDWWSSYLSYAKTNHITAGAVSIGAPSEMMLTGSTAYAVWPATFRYRQSGKPRQEAGTFTIAFVKTPTGWLMSGWTWTTR